ncbi:hypothetical protein LTR65_008979 [Meristemomyces frigidus]
MVPPTSEQVHPPWKRVRDSVVFSTDAADRLSIRSKKRMTEDQQAGPNKTPRHDVTIGDLDLPANYFFVLRSDPLDEGFRSGRAFMGEVCKEMNARNVVFKGDGWISTVEESKKRGGSGDIGLFPVPEFRAGPSEPDEECLYWFPCRQGIIIVKMRPGLICDNAD